MKKVLPVVAVAALLASGACLAQGQTSGQLLIDGTVGEPSLNLSPPVVYYPVERATVVSPSSRTVIVTEPVVASAVMPSAAVIYYTEPVVLVGDTRGPIKLGGPKYDSQGRSIYAPRDVR